MYLDRKETCALLDKPRKEAHDFLRAHQLAQHSARLAATIRSKGNILSQQVEQTIDLTILKRVEELRHHSRMGLDGHIKARTLLAHLRLGAAEDLATICLTLAHHRGDF